MELIDLNELMKFPIRKDHYDKENGSEQFVNGVESVLEYAQHLPHTDPMGWIPFTFRALDEHEKEIYPDWTFMFTCELPNSGDDILVSDGKYTWCDTFWNEEFCSLESDREIHEGMAWMPFPEPHKQEKKE